MELYTNQLLTTKLNIKRSSGSVRQADGTRKYKQAAKKCYDIFTFDLENTNAWVLPDGTVTGYVKGKSAEYWNSLTPVALVYIWQFSINDKVYYGRDLVDFLHVLDHMPKETHCIVWIHNLSHEMSFLLNILTVKDVFARGTHSPIKLTFEEYPDIEFRCTYALTNLSLADWGKQIGCEKLVGLLDYDGALRTPKSVLSEDEMRYSEMDCIVVYNGILNELKTYKTIFKIPNTSTGKIRKVCKSLLFQEKSYSSYIKRMCPTYDELVMLMSCFSGGYTHCNRIHADTKLTGKITHWDFTSSYPTVLFFKYPVTRFRKSDGLFIHKESEKYAYMYKVTFYNVKSTNPNTYIQLSKAHCTGNVKRDNGRLISCDVCTLTLTDVDMKIIDMVYKYDYVKVQECWYANKDYLDRNFLNYILTLYADKTELKGVSGQENFYMQQKAFLNSLY